VLGGRVAIITGAGQGIGQGIALAFAKEGAALALVGRTESKLRDTASQVDAYDCKALVVPADLSDRTACDEVVSATVAHFGTVDVLVNNAASTRPLPLIDITDEDLESDLISLRATLSLMQACFPYLRRPEGVPNDGRVVNGKIINFGSGAGTQGSPLHATYAAAKEGIRGLSKVAANEWGPLGINVNVVCPAALTPMAREAWKVKGRTEEEWASQIVMRRIGDAERDIGRVCVFLAGPDSDFIQGRTLHVDGGQAAYDR
jgi:NAD(P)-dependent dehydrogenase (short-subunit alcohol dehydrogenase family)